MTPIFVVGFFVGAFAMWLVGLERRSRNEHRDCLTEVARLLEEDRAARKAAMPPGRDGTLWLRVAGVHISIEPPPQSDSREARAVMNAIANGKPAEWPIGVAVKRVA